MKKLSSILLLLLLFLVYNKQLYAQIILNTTGNGCGFRDTLKVNGAANANYIEWFHNSIEYDHTLTPASSVRSVAGSIFRDSTSQYLLGLNKPKGVFLDTIGDIYIADDGNHRIVKFPHDAIFPSPGVTVAGGNGYGGAANQLAKPTGVFVDKFGLIYVADKANNRIQRFYQGNSQQPGETLLCAESFGKESALFLVCASV